MNSGSGVQHTEPKFLYFAWTENIVKVNSPSVENHHVHMFYDLSVLVYDDLVDSESKPVLYTCLLHRQ